MQLKEGTLLKNGKYKVLRVLGQGGFGITYLATLRQSVQGSLGSFDAEITVAVKEFFMKSCCTRDADATQVCTSAGAQVSLIDKLKRRFVKEAKMLSSLHHENIVPVTDVFEENNTCYYIMQYLEGGSLKTWVEKNGPMSEKEAKMYIRQVGDALSYLHNTRQMCHFDVKPANIMLNGKGQAVLIDFGISKQYASSKDTSLSAPVGLTPGFSPLEQYQGVMPDFSPSSDVYSLACTLYYLLTGTVPPDAPTIMEHGLGPQPDAISSQCWEAISRAMMPLRNDRLQTIREFVDILDSPVAGEETVPSVATPDASADEEDTVSNSQDDRTGITPTSSRQFKIPGTSIILALCACVVAAMAVWFLYPRSKEVTDLSWTDTHQEQFQYTGSVRNGKPHGEGVARYADGRLYEGTFRKGLKDGKARFTDRCHSVFTGVYAADTIQSGRLDYYDGTIYFEGDFVNDQPYDGLWYYVKGNKPFVRLTQGKENKADE